MRCYCLGLHRRRPPPLGGAAQRRRRRNGSVEAARHPHRPRRIFRLDAVDVVSVAGFLLLNLYHLLLPLRRTIHLLHLHQSLRLPRRPACLRRLLKVPA
jgi:hypothetical protein